MSSNLSSATATVQEMDSNIEQSDLLDASKIVEEYQELNKKLDQAINKIKSRKKK